MTKMGQRVRPTEALARSAIAACQATPFWEDRQLRRAKVPAENAGALRSQLRALLADPAHPGWDQVAQRALHDLEATPWECGTRPRTDGSRERSDLDIADAARIAAEAMGAYVTGIPTTERNWMPRGWGVDPPSRALAPIDGTEETIGREDAAALGGVPEAQCHPSLIAVGTKLESGYPEQGDEPEIAAMREVAWAGAPEEGQTDIITLVDEREGWVRAAIALTRSRKDPDWRDPAAASLHLQIAGWALLRGRRDGCRAAAAAAIGMVLTQDTRRLIRWLPPGGLLRIHVTRAIGVPPDVALSAHHAIDAVITAAAAARDSEHDGVVQVRWNHEPCGDLPRGKRIPPGGPLAQLAAELSAETRRLGLNAVTVTTTGRMELVVDEDGRLKAGHRRSVPDAVSAGIAVEGFDLCGTKAAALVATQKGAAIMPESAVLDESDFANALAAGQVAFTAAGEGRALIEEGMAAFLSTLPAHCDVLPRIAAMIAHANDEHSGTLTRH
jgi:hypothetical protein